MQSNPHDKAILGGYFLIVGLVMLIFHKQVKETYEDLFAGQPWIMRWSMPRGVFLTVMIVVFGAMCVIGGIALLLLAFV